MMLRDEETPPFDVIVEMLGILLVQICEMIKEKEMFPQPPTNARAIMETMMIFDMCFGA